MVLQASVYAVGGNRGDDLHRLVTNHVPDLVMIEESTASHHHFRCDGSNIRVTGRNGRFQSKKKPQCDQVVTFKRGHQHTSDRMTLIRRQLIIITGTNFLVIRYITNVKKLETCPIQMHPLYKFTEAHLTSSYLLKCQQNSNLTRFPSMTPFTIKSQIIFTSMTHQKFTHTSQIASLSIENDQIPLERQTPLPLPYYCIINHNYSKQLRFEHHDPHILRFTFTRKRTVTILKEF